MHHKKIFLVLVCLAVTACQTVLKHDDIASNLLRQAERERSLQVKNDWSFRARLAISNGNQAGTVKIHWQQHGEQFDIEILLPITNQKYRLRSINNKARLEGFGLVMLEGDSAEAVLQQITGWRIPFRDMQQWLRGIRTSSATDIEFGPAGLPAQFRENGWLVDYREWNSALTPMPMKVFASSIVNGKSASIHLLVETWEAQ